MKRSFHLTTEEFLRELRRAALDDRRWPHLCRHQWLLDHAQSKDGEIFLVIDCDHAPKPAIDPLCA